MEFIKNLFVSLGKFAYAFVVEPIIEMRHFFKFTATEKVLKTLDAASRVLIIGSYFLALPALLVTLSWIWVWTTLFVGIGYIAFQFGAIMALSGGLENMMKAETANDEKVVPAAA